MVLSEGSLNKSMTRKDSSTQADIRLTHEAHLRTRVGCNKSVVTFGTVMWPIFMCIIFIVFFIFFLCIVGRTKLLSSLGFAHSVYSLPRKIV